MRFARIVFRVAGIWGITVLMPFYWLVDLTGRAYPAPTQYPQFFYGFFAVALAWQVAFLVIASDPVRFRPMMVAAALEKFGYVGTLMVLYGQVRITAQDAFPVLPDLLLGILFIVAFAKTSGAAGRAPE
jgi:hypothetical protein